MTEDVRPAPRFRVPWLPVGGLVLLFLVLLPARFATLRGDDVWTFQARGLRELEHQSFAAHVLESMRHAVEVGRPLFLGGIQGDVTTLIFEGHPMAYRVFIVVLTVVAAALLYRLAIELGAPPAVGLLVLALLGGAVQFRAYHDAMLGYHGTTQCILILLVGSLLAFLRWLRGGRRRDWILALALYVPILLMYESTGTLCAAHVGLALLERRGRPAVRAVAPFVGVSIAFIALAFIARRYAETVPAGYEVSFSLARIIRTYATQLFPPLPGSNLLFDPNLNTFYAIGASPTKAELLGAAWRGAAVFVIVLALALQVRRHPARLPAPGVAGRLAAVGAMLWLSPVMLISFAPKYQIELAPGKGYLPTLIQVFGWALVAAAALIAVARLASARSSTAVLVTGVAGACVLGYGAAISGFNNLRVAAYETPVSEARDLLETAAGHGVFDAIPEQATLLFSRRDTLWPTGNWKTGPASVEAMLLRRTGRRFDGRIVADETPLDCARREGVFPPPDCSPLADEAAWVRFRDFRGGGTVIVARLGTDHSRTAAHDVARNLRVLVEADGGGDPPPPRLVGQTATRRPWRSDGVSWRKAAGDDGWAIYDGRVTGVAPVAARLDDPRARVDFTALGPSEQVARVYGTKRLLP
jgi:hypothetical protein